MGIYYIVLITARLGYEKYYQLKGKRIYEPLKVKDIDTLKNRNGKILINLLKENGNVLIILNINN